MVLKKADPAGSWDNVPGWDVGDSPAGLGSSEPAHCAPSLAASPGRASMPCSDAKKKKKGASIRVITGQWLLNAPRRMLSPWSRDACHGRLRGLGRCECWVPAAGCQGCLVEPSWRLLGVRGGGGASDSQEIPGDRYLGSLGRALLTHRTPAVPGTAAHPTVFSRLAPGGGGRSRRPRAARGRVSVGARSPVNNSTGFLRSPRCRTASSLCPPFCITLFPCPVKPQT